MWKQVPQVVAPVVKKECLTLLSSPKPYWMRTVWRQRIFFYIKRFFSKTSSEANNKDKPLAADNLQSYHAKPPAPSCGPTHSHILLLLKPATSSTLSLQRFLETIHHNKSPVTIGNNMENHLKYLKLFNHDVAFKEVYFFLTLKSRH